MAIFQRVFLDTFSMLRENMNMNNFFIIVDAVNIEGASKKYKYDEARAQTYAVLI